MSASGTELMSEDSFYLSGKLALQLGGKLIAINQPAGGLSR